MSTTPTKAYYSPQMSVPTSPSSNFLEWDEEAVCDWLEEQGMGQYREVVVGEFLNAESAICFEARSTRHQATLVFLGILNLGSLDSISDSH